MMSTPTNQPTQLGNQHPQFTQVTIGDLKGRRCTQWADQLKECNRSVEHPGCAKGSACTALHMTFPSDYCDPNRACIEPGCKKIHGERVMSEVTAGSRSLGLDLGGCRDAVPGPIVRARAPVVTAPVVTAPVVTAPVRVPESAETAAAETNAAAETVSKRQRARDETTHYCGAYKRQFVPMFINNLAPPDIKEVKCLGPEHCWRRHRVLRRNVCRIENCVDRACKHVHPTAETLIDKELVTQEQHLEERRTSAPSGVSIPGVSMSGLTLGDVMRVQEVKKGQARHRATLKTGDASKTADASAIGVPAPVVTNAAASASMSYSAAALRTDVAPRMTVRRGEYQPPTDFTRMPVPARNIPRIKSGQLDLEVERQRDGKTVTSKHPFLYQVRAYGGNSATHNLGTHGATDPFVWPELTKEEKKQRAKGVDVSNERLTGAFIRKMYGLDCDFKGEQPGPTNCLILLLRSICPGFIPNLGPQPSIELVWDRQQPRIRPTREPVSFIQAVRNLIFAMDALRPHKDHRTIANVKVKSVAKFIINWINMHNASRVGGTILSCDHGLYKSQEGLVQDEGGSADEEPDFVFAFEGEDEDEEAASVTNAAAKAASAGDEDGFDLDA